MLNEIQKPDFGFRNKIRFYIFDEQNLIFFHFHQENYIKFTKMSGKINSHICLSVYESFHQTVKYGQQRNRILQDITGV